MNEEKPTGSKQVNIMLDIHTNISSLPIIFRERICEECNWSTPTFYRKMRTYDQPSPTDRTKMISVLSNAEKQKILEVLEETFIMIAGKCQKYMKNTYMKTSGQTN